MGHITLSKETIATFLADFDKLQRGFVDKNSLMYALKEAYISAIVKENGDCLYDDLPTLQKASAYLMIPDRKHRYKTTRQVYDCLLAFLIHYKDEKQDAMEACAFQFTATYNDYKQGGVKEQKFDDIPKGFYSLKTPVNVIIFVINELIRTGAVTTVLSNTDIALDNAALKRPVHPGSTGSDEEPLADDAQAEAEINAVLNSVSESSPYEIGLEYFQKYFTRKLRDDNAALTLLAMLDDMTSHELCIYMVKQQYYASFDYLYSTLVPFIKETVFEQVLKSKRIMFVRSESERMSIRSKKISISAQEIEEHCELIEILFQRCTVDFDQSGRVGKDNLFYQRLDHVRWFFTLLGERLLALQSPQPEISGEVVERDQGTPSHEEALYQTHINALQQLFANHAKVVNGLVAERDALNAECSALRDSEKAMLERNIKLESDNKALQALVDEQAKTIAQQKQQLEDWVSPEEIDTIIKLRTKLGAEKQRKLLE